MNYERKNNPYKNDHATFLATFSETRIITKTEAHLAARVCSFKRLEIHLLLSEAQKKKRRGHHGR